MLNLVARSAETNDWARLVGLRETYAPAAMALLLTSVIRVSLLHLELYGLKQTEGLECMNLFSHIKREEKQIRLHQNKRTDLVKRNKITSFFK